jgi:rubrerythrin
MYSREAITEIFQRILKFEEDAKVLYDDCIEKLDDENIISILRSISNEEKGHIELAKRLMELIQE